MLIKIINAKANFENDEFMIDVNSRRCTTELFGNSSFTLQSL